MTAKRFASKIKVRREQLGLTQQQVADKSRMDLSAVSRYEAGKHCPSFRIVKRFALALRCEARDLLGV